MVSRSLVQLSLAALLISLGNSAARAEFTPVTGFEQQLFPSYLIATANLRGDKSKADPHRLGDASGLLGVEIVSPDEDTPVKVTVECGEFLETSVFSGTLTEADVTYTITPKIKYRFDRLANCHQATPANVTIRVQLGDDAEEEQTVTCTVRSINDCPFAFQQGDQVVDTSFAFAAYVNEQHPFVDKLLREALDRGVVTSFRGYQAKKPADVILQAYAIWDLLVARDVRYSSITTTAVDSDSVLCQHVRLIEDSINNSQANCVDGSVLWVSMLRKIGIDGFLVITPSHCYAGFYLDPKHEAALAIETTLLGEALAADEVEVPESLNAAVTEDMRYDDSFTSFVAALGHGTTAYLASQKSDTSDDAPPETRVVDIARMRKLGVLPIAFQNKEEFVGYDFSLADSDDEMSNTSADDDTDDDTDEDSDDEEDDSESWDEDSDEEDSDDEEA